MTRLVTYNILDGGAGRIDPLAEVIRHLRPDVAVCVEADHEGNFQLLARRLDMHEYWAAPVAKHPVGVLSALPILEAVNHGRPPLERTCAEVRVRLPGGGELTVFAVHLRAQASVEREELRVREVQTLLKITADARKAARPHVIMGDFNASHPSQQLDPTAMRGKDRKAVDAQGGVVPRRAIKRMLDAGYVDAYDALHGSSGGLTLSTLEPSLRTDYIFLPPLLVGRLLACDVHRERLARYASDHYPVWAELDL